MRFFPWKYTPKDIDNELIEKAERSIHEAERVTRFQQRLTRLAEAGRTDEFMRVATGAYPADVAADRKIDSNGYDYR
jgi:hypothetical protein